MINWISEGSPVKQGLNIYRPSDKSSVGFKLRLSNWLWMVRYSKNTQKISSATKTVSTNMPEWAK